MSARRCRECGITHIEPGTEIDGEPLCWHDADLCSRCHDHLQAALERDAARYRFLRDVRTRSVCTTSPAASSIFPPGEQVEFLHGEHLDRAIDAEMGAAVPDEDPLEDRLAECLADIIDTPLLTLPDTRLSLPMQIFVGSFRPELGARAAEFLEEAGR